MVFTQFHQTAGRRRYPMRCVQNKRFGYIFNAWADGKRVFLNESQSGRTFKAMKAAAAAGNQTVAARVRLFQYRVVEEFYDFEKDPDARHNLIGSAAYREQIDELRGELRELCADVVLARNGLLADLFDRSALESLLQRGGASASDGERLDPARWGRRVWLLLMLGMWDRNVNKSQWHEGHS